MPGRARALQTRAAPNRRLGADCTTRATSSTADLLARLAAEGAAEQLPSGAFAAREGSLADSLLVLSEGVLMRCKSLPGDRRQVSGFVYGPALVMPPRFGAAWPCSLQAVGTTAYSRIGRRAFQRFLQFDPRLYPLLLALAQEELQDQQELLLTLACRTPPERIASFLLRIARRGKEVIPADTAVALPMTRVQIADHLGLAPETVSRAFARLAAEGLVVLPRPSRVVLRDPAALLALAEGRTAPI